MMASRCGAESTGLQSTTNRRDASEQTEDVMEEDEDVVDEENDAGEYVPAHVTALPRWMRLYFYGMHGVTVDVVLSSLRGLFLDRDPKLVGFSSPYRCLVHALTHLLLEQLYAQRKRFRDRPWVFALALYPSAYIGLQILLASVNTWTEHALFPAPQLAVQYLVALYFSLVFHKGMRMLQYRHPARSPGGVATPAESETPAALPKGLPDVAHFVFYGMHGFLDEVVFTAVFNVMEPGGSFSGHTSIWSFLMYGSCSFVVEKLYMRLRYAWGWSTWRRLPLYVCFIYAWEFSCGLALRQFGACSWDYSHYPHNVMGLVTLVYMPGWMGLSLYQDVLSNALFRVQCVGGSEEEEEEGTGGRKGEEEWAMNGNVDPSKKVL